MATILDGKKLSEEIHENLKTRVSKLNKKYTLSIIYVGDDYASGVYTNMKKKACEKIGLNCEIIRFDNNATTEMVVSEINKLNETSNVCGIMIQHPMPKQIDEDACFNAISEEKDVDGLNKISLANISVCKTGFVPATAKGVISLLDKYEIDVSGKNAVVIGRSRIVGKPIAYLLTNKNATVTLAHSKTENLENLVKNADIVVSAVGKPKFITENMIKENAVIIDTGFNEGNVGDVDIESCKNKCSFYTPVPGGVGPMTIASLIEQCVISAEKMD